MMIGAREAGFTPIGNFEDRKFMVPKTFTSNFPGAFFEDPKELKNSFKTSDGLYSPDLVLGHPPCGNFSHLTFSAQNIKDLSKRRKDPGRIPEFMEAVKTLQPRFFLMENLPKSLKAYDEDAYQKMIGDDYNFSIEHVSNYHYGNPQKYRKRMFVIGWRKDEDFSFKQLEEPRPERTVREVLKGLTSDDIPEINHTHIDLDEVANIYFGVNGDGTTKKYTYRKIKQILLDLPPGKTPTYISKDGTPKKKIGVLRLYWDKHAHTITGGGWRRAMNKFHPITAEPLTIREILRIQGAPDDFIIHGELEDQIPQVGKFIAVEFPTFACKQIYKYLTEK